ncbi:MAG: AAA family ATPase [Thauera sp.]|nr:AAA family ATPase [Thauera sp.]
MWISRIALRNFKSYQNQVFEFPQPARGRNLVLVGGINGYGKTTLLEAVYVGLYGEEAVSHRALDRAGLHARGYGHFLETAFYKHALRNGDDRMEVSIEITRPEKGRLRITRKWFFNSSGKYDSQRLVIETQGAGSSTWTGRPEVMLPALLSSYAVPPWLAPFFFFDGEKIAVLADEDRTRWILSGLENLLGVVLVRELREKLAEYSTAKLRQAGGVDEERVSELGEQLTQKTARRDELAEALHELQTEFQRGGEQRERLTRQLRDLAQGSDARTVADVVEASARAEQDEDHYRTQLRKMMSTALPLQLVRRQLHDALTEALEQEDTLSSWEHFRDEQQPRWQKFHDTFFNSAWIAGVCHLPGARDSLERTLAEAWESLYSPRPSGCADFHWHRYLQTNERRKLADMRQRIRVSGSALRTLAIKLDEAIHERWRLQQERIRLEGADGTDRSAEAEQLSTMLTSIQLRLEELRGLIDVKDNELIALNADISQLSATYERERKKLVEGHPERIAAQRAERVVAMIDDLLPALFELKLRALSDATTRLFRRLHHKDQVARIEIQNDGKAVLFSHEGSEIHLPKSSGESQLFVLSLVGALAEVTGYNVPLIVDTPLARLSETHCKNLLDYWTEDGTRQVILLAQDKEIGAIEFARLGKHVAKSYLLQHAQMGHGVGRTEAVADRYFAGTA